MVDNVDNKIAVIPGQRVDVSDSSERAKKPVRIHTGVKIKRDNPTAVLLEQQMRDHGGMLPNSVFMETSLRGPDGYYKKGRAEIGTGDFNTSSEVSEMFGQTLGMATVKVWEAMEKPTHFDVVEMGAGTGAMADSLLSWAKNYNRPFYDALSYTIVEYGDLIQKQKIRIRDQEKVQWIQGSAADHLFEQGSINGVFLSNELPDTFPVEVVQKINGTIKQKYMTLEEDEWVEVWDDPSEAVMQYIHTYQLPIQEAIEEPINLTAVQWQRAMNRALGRGAIITVDYGDETTVGTSQHPATRIYGDDASPLAVSEYYQYKNPGRYDITSDVNFAVLAKAAEQDGLAVAFSATQREFLLNNGINSFVEPALEAIKQVSSWPEVIRLSEKLGEYKKLIGLGADNLGEFFVQALTKGISVDFNADLPPMLSLDTGIRLQVGVPSGKRIRLTIEPENARDKEKVFLTSADTNGGILLDRLPLLPHELVGKKVYETRAITVATRDDDQGDELVFSTRESSFSEVLQRSGYLLN